jgi:hypothetical protein
VRVVSCMRENVRSFLVSFACSYTQNTSSCHILTMTQDARVPLLRLAQPLHSGAQCEYSSSYSEPRPFKAQQLTLD